MNFTNGLASLRCADKGSTRVADSISRPTDSLVIPLLKNWRAAIFGKAMCLQESANAFDTHHPRSSICNAARPLAGLSRLPANLLKRPGFEIAYQPAQRQFV